MKHKQVLITGAAGFVGSHLVKRLQKDKTLKLILFDKLDPAPLLLKNENTTYIQGNLTNKNDIQKLFNRFKSFDIIFHFASEMPNKLADSSLMWNTNVEGTAYLAELAEKTGTKSFIFTSSNVTYGIPASLPVNEQTPTLPLESYGKSKLAAEKVLESYKNNMNIQIFRCPVITGEGRLGLQAVLYEFISENKRIYTLGDGTNKYQFLDVEDAIDAFLLASRHKGFDIYVIGADHVLTLNELFTKVIKQARSTSTLVALPSRPLFLLLWLLDKINYSPLGIYQITMMSRSLYADTTKLKQTLGWKPRKTNEDTFIDNYQWYKKHKGEFKEMGGQKDSPNRSVPKMGVLKLVKIFS